MAQLSGPDMCLLFPLNMNGINIKQKGEKASKESVKRGSVLITPKWDFNPTNKKKANVSMPKRATTH